jgi:hypothetical protein
MKDKAKAEGGFRSAAEQQIPAELENIFENSSESISQRLEHFPKFIRRQRMTRLLSLYELFKEVLDVKGSIVECGVHNGFGVFSMLHFSSILEPNNITRRIYGFDTFSGLQGIQKEDESSQFSPSQGELSVDSFDELSKLSEIHNDNRFLGHMDKISLIKGDAQDTIPQFIDEHKHLVVSLLFLDFDLYAPTKTALEHFVPRMPKGAVIAFDELDNPIWPGETMALLDTLGMGRLELKRFSFDPYIGFAKI